MITARVIRDRDLHNKEVERYGEWVTLPVLPRIGEKLALRPAGDKKRIDVVRDIVYVGSEKPLREGSHTVYEVHLLIDTPAMAPYDPRETDT